MVLERSALLVVGLAACNQVYGLDETTIREMAIDAPPDLEDEDLDAAPNEFDNCPGIVNVDQRDSDGDQVGDLCDPNPMSAVDRIVVRHMFNRRLIDPDAWTGNGWTFRDGFVEQATAGEDATMFTVQTPSGSTIVVEARITITRLQPDYARTTIVLEGLGGDACIVADGTSPYGVSVTTPLGLNVAGNSSMIVENVPFTLRATSVRIPAEPVMPSTHCQIGGVETSLGTVEKPPDTIGIATNDNAARVDYVVIYATN